jgi:hypothetical protein
MAKRSMNFMGMNSKHGRYARSVQALIDAMAALGMSDDEIRHELLKLKAEREAAEQRRALQVGVEAAPGKAE